MRQKAREWSFGLMLLNISSFRQWLALGFRGEGQGHQADHRKRGSSVLK
jgi:hypothetical protein